ncbi:hypothetical protein BDY19DRAFT_992994 [Irpex rosettiformis]|uniref:Uncharacterized protein n=1 Tax=Irpex rosettiformis TaxID=378272 RepID=A0ACB8U4V8_9APHY|nr:hypothetical protein BDY19DRAFT_992994 [Irpex rosettiformis]
MRSSAVVALAILVASSPAFAAPTGPSYPAKGPSSPIKNEAIDAQHRKLADVIAREVDTDDQSGAAVNWGKALNIAGGAAGLLSSLTPGHDKQQQQKREEILELLSRQDNSDDSGAANLGKIFNIVSGVGGAAGLVGSLAGNHDQPQQKRTEDIFELIARQDGADTSGAVNWGKILNVAGGVGSAAGLLGSLIPGHDQKQQKRAEALVELMARQDGDASSGAAANWGKVADVGSKVISGLGTAAGLGGTGVGIWDKMHEGQKREDLIEFLTREVPFDTISARAPPSKVGAAFDKGSQIIGGFGGLASLGSALVDHFHKDTGKREELIELLARQNADGGAGDLNVSDILHKVTSLLGVKRQE